MNRRYWVTIRKNDYNKIEDIMADMYERGEIDSIREDWGRVDEVMLGVQCMSDDLLIMQEKFKNRGVIFH